MSCPPDKKPNVDQFADDADLFWQDFQAANPAKDLTELRIYFDLRYAHCFATVLRASKSSNAFELPSEVQAKIRECMLAP